MFNPKYTITPKIVSGISELSEIKAVVERSRVLPLNEAQLRRQAIIRMAHTSTSIEGNKLAEFEVGKVVAGGVVRGGKKDILEVENYLKALQEINRLSKTKNNLIIKEILALHRIVITGLVDQGKAGAFRPDDVYVLDELGQGKQRLRFKAPPAHRAPQLLDNLLNFVAKAKREGVHPVVITGIFHLEFVSIHPFTDGNGRVARLLTQLLLYRMNWDFRKIIVLEDYYNRDRLTYYNAEHFEEGNEYDQKRDFTHWLEYFVTGFVIEARKVLEQVQAIGYGKVSKTSEQIFLDGDEIKIMDFLTTTGRLTSDDVVDILKIAKRTAQLKLKSLLSKKLLKQQGRGPTTYYTLTQ